jgi:hypothetical protein
MTVSGGGHLVGGMTDVPQVMPRLAGAVAGHNPPVTGLGPALAGNRPRSRRVFAPGRGCSCAARRTPSPAPRRTRGVPGYLVRGSGRAPDSPPGAEREPSPARRHGHHASLASSVIHQSKRRRQRDGVPRAGARQPGQRRAVHFQQDRRRHRRRTAGGGVRGRPRRPRPRSSRAPGAGREFRGGERDHAVQEGPGDRSRRPGRHRGCPAGNSSPVRQRGRGPSGGAGGRPAGAADGAALGDRGGPGRRGPDLPVRVAPAPRPRPVHAGVRAGGAGTIRSRHGTRGHRAAGVAGRAARPCPPLSGTRNRGPGTSAEARPHPSRRGQGPSHAPSPGAPGRSAKR